MRGNVMESSIYTAKVMHHRLAPKKHSFWYTIYFFYIDIDEIDNLSKRLKWFGHNKFNLFNFRDKDHLQVRTYLKLNNVEIGNGKIMLLTNLSVLGYNFNPVSFYFCFDENKLPVCAVAEISNTYREMKFFFFGKDELEGHRFKQRVQKNFYVSPFIDLDAFFDFDLAIPTEKLNIKIDDYDNEGERFFISTLTGEKKPLTNGNMLRYFFSVPLIPLQVMGLIHWQAFKLWIKKITYHPKAANQHLQKDVYNRYKP